MRRGVPKKQGELPRKDKVKKIIKMPVGIPVEIPQYQPIDVPIRKENNGQQTWNN